MFELLGIPPQALFGQLLLGLIKMSFGVLDLSLRTRDSAIAADSLIAHVCQTLQLGIAFAQASLSRKSRWVPCDRGLLLPPYLLLNGN